LAHFLTAANKKKPEALGTSRPIFKLLGLMEISKKKNLKSVEDLPFEVRVGKQGILAILLLAPGFQISVMALATLLAPSVQKESLRKRNEVLRIGDER